MNIELQGALSLRFGLVSAYASRGRKGRLFDYLSRIVDFLGA